MTLYPLLSFVSGVYTEGSILPVRPDRRLHSWDRCQWLLLPAARHPACAGYVLRYLRAQRALTLPGQCVYVCVSVRYCVFVCSCVHIQSSTNNKSNKKQHCLFLVADGLYDSRKKVHSLKEKQIGSEQVLQTIINIELASTKLMLACLLRTRCMKNVAAFSHICPRQHRIQCIHNIYAQIMIYTVS